MIFLIMYVNINDNAGIDMKNRIYDMGLLFLFSHYTTIVKGKPVHIDSFLIKVKLFEALRLRLIETTFKCFSISF